MRYKRKTNYWQQDIRKLEYLYALLKGILLIGMVSYLFYDTWIGIILFSPYLILYIKSWEKQTIKKRQEVFRTQFKEAILSLSAALHVGYSVENALREVIRDLQGLYKKDAMILKELSYMARQIQMNVPVEEAWNQFAGRIGDGDVHTFVTVFNMAKRSGGDTLEMIRNTARQMGDKIDVEREIQTLISAKKMELNIMSAIPFGMIAYLKFSFPEFLDVLYGNGLGVLIMSVCLVIYLVAYYAGKRMVEIEV